MEFGALQCIPSSPDCENCPFSTICIAKATNIIPQLPIKALKTKVTNRFFNYLFVEFQDLTFLQKRTGKDVWQNLYEFPLIETEKLLNPTELIENLSFKALFEGIDNIEITKTTNPMKHVLSHRVIYAQFISIKINKLNEKFEGFTKVKTNQIDEFAVSRLMELFLEKL